MKNRRQYTYYGVVVGALLLVVAAAVLTAMWWQRNRTARTASVIIPSSIRQQLEAVALIPLQAGQGDGQGADTVSIDKGTILYDAPSKTLSFTTYVQGVKTVVTEQPTPSSIVDIPEYYDKMVEKMRRQGSFETDMGKVDLTQPDDLNGDQVAVMNAKGVLLFAHAEGELAEGQWRQFFKSLQVVK